MHVLALQPAGDIASGLIGATLGHRALLAQLLQPRLVIRVDARLGHVRGTGAAHVFGLGFAAHNAANRAVHQQIGVTANRRGEVRVGGVVQAKVPVVFRRVAGLAERAQHHGLNQVEVRAVLDGLQQRLVILRCRLATAFIQGQAQLGQKAAQLLQLLLRRPSVHTEQGRQTMLLEELGCRHVGAQHAFFDQFVRVVTLGGANVGNLAIGTKHDARFGGFEVNRTALGTRRQQHVIQRIQLL